MRKMELWQTPLAGFSGNFFTKKYFGELHQAKSALAIVDKFPLSIGSLSGKVKSECRPRAVLEAASFFVGCFASAVEFGPQQLAEKKQLGLHQN